MLDVQNISVRFGTREILRDVSMRAETGNIVALLGPNGAGKTTLLRACNGTVTLDAGRIELDGTSLSSLSRREIATSIAVVAQENETKFPITVFEFVVAGRFARGAAFGWETPADIESARRSLELCDLADFADRFMNELSGGERQRVVLARALAAETRVLLLDEPTANLDLSHQGLMLRLVRGRCVNAGATAIVITHDLNLAAEFADVVVLLKNGSVMASGSPSEALTAANVRELYDVNVLLDENPANGKVRVTTLYQ